jgi:hypothetical protein
MSLSGAIQLDPRRFWGDINVRRMDVWGVGVYWAILCHQWENGNVPADPADLAVILTAGAFRPDAERLAAELADGGLLAAVLEEDPDAPGCLRNPALHDQREEWRAKKARWRDAKREARASDGKTSARRPRDVAKTSGDVIREGKGREGKGKGRERGGRELKIGEVLADCGRPQICPADGRCVFCCIWDVWREGLSQDANKKKAREQFHRAVTRASPGEIFKGAVAYAYSFPPDNDPSKVMHLFRWLRDDRWTERPAPYNDRRRMPPGPRFP